MEAIIFYVTIFLIIFIFYLANKGKQLKKEIAELENEKIEKKTLIEKFAEASNNSLINDTDLEGNKKTRKWVAAMYAEVLGLMDTYRAEYLEWKKRPSYKGAEVVKEVKQEKRGLLKKVKYLEYQLKTYEEYFPIIEEIKDYVLEDDTFLFNLGDKNLEDEVDPTQRFLKPEEFKKLNASQKNQLALDRYKKKKHSNLEIGRIYERYLGYIYELEGWVVKFTGIIDGFDDLGRDLICTKDNEIHIVQAKNWSKFKIIREKYLYQHFATTTHYKLQNKIPKKIKVTPVFYSTIDYSDMAKKVAKALSIDIKTKKLDWDYPMIKCNVNPQTKEKIYHLPFDQQYDKIIIGNNEGECYVNTVAQATAKGFRRAFKYRGPA
jgi:hypothetical protein